MAVAEHATAIEMPDTSSSERAGHILSTAKWRFDLTVTVRAFGNLNFGIFVDLKHFVFQRRVTCATGCVDTHAADFTFVGSHYNPLRLVGFGCF